MADNTDLLNQIRQIAREENEPLKKGLDEQGKKLDEHGKKLDRLEDGQNRQYTALKVLQAAIEDTRHVVDKVIAHPRLVLRDRCGELTQGLERGGARAANLNPRVHVQRTRPFFALA